MIFICLLTNPQWLELPMSRTHFHGPKDVRAIEVRLYEKLTNTGFFLFGFHDLYKIISLMWNLLSMRCWQKPEHRRKYSWTDTYTVCLKVKNLVQSTVVISKSKGLSEILQDIRTSTYQICRIEEKLIRTTTFNKYICNCTLEVRDILKIL